MNILSVEKLELQKVLKHIAEYAITDEGKDFILALSPQTDKDLIRREGTLVSEAKEILINRDIPPFEYLPKMGELINSCKVEGAAIHAGEMLYILKLLQISRFTIGFVKSSAEYAPSFEEFLITLFSDKILEHHISSAIGENGEVKDSASKQLRTIRTDLIEKQEELRKIVGRIVKQLTEEKLTREEYVTLRDGRIVIPVKSEYKRQIKGFIHSESNSGQTVYIEPEQTLALNNDIISLGFAEKREIERILRELTAKIREYASALLQSYKTLVYIDTLFSRAKHSIEIIGSFPTLSSDGKFEILSARHPILLQRLGREHTVPFDLNFGSSNVIIITGPNAGGKTVVLKSVGLLALMVQSGLHIPVSPDSSFPVFTSMFIDIGDMQSIDDDLSTFSSHLRKLNEIISVADSNTLVLLDEIGSGTDPEAGGAIAAATLEHLAKVNAKALATTHLGSIKLIANSLPGMQNASMEFDTEELIPTYKFRQGFPGSSYAFEIAQRIGFASEFLTKARSFMKGSESRIEEMLFEIEDRSKKLSALLNKAEVENVRLTGLTELYDQKVKKLQVEKNNLLKQLKAESELKIREAEKTINLTIKDIRESNADKESVKHANSVINSMKSTIAQITIEEVDESDENSAPLLIGDSVMVKQTSTYGKIIEINEQRKIAVIQAGTLKLQVKLTELQRGKQKKERNFGYSSDIVENNYYYNTGAAYRLDLRGKRADEIEYELLSFLDSAYTSGTERVEILHGKGNGVLRSVVGEILKKYRHVSNFAPAPIEHGGFGITLVDFSK